MRVRMIRQIQLAIAASALTAMFYVGSGRDRTGGLRADFGNSDRRHRCGDSERNCGGD